MSNLSGRCFCGAVQWVCNQDVLWAGHCHCDSCRRACSAPFTSFFGVHRLSVTWSGQMVDHTTSGGRVRRQFCAACGSPMTYQNDIWPDETHLYAATLDNPEKFAPEAHFHYAERLPWIDIQDDLPKHPGSAN